MAGGNMKARVKARIEGAKAYELGVPRAANHYCTGTDEHTQWEVGFDEASRSVASQRKRHDARETGSHMQLPFFTQPRRLEADQNNEVFARVRNWMFSGSTKDAA
jgi:hypothetical protein